MSRTAGERAKRLAPQPYAQTPLQLTNQALAAGWDADELVKLRSWIQLATALFTAQVRATWKPFISHLVGTASIVAASGCRMELVGAALLHAAYTHGDFGMGSGIVRPRDRVRLRLEAGTGVEYLIDRYTAQRWDPATEVGRALATLQTLSPVEHDVLRLRIANELDDLLDLGIVWSNHGRSHPFLSGQALGAAEDLARRLDMAGVGEELVTAVNESRSALTLLADVSLGTRAPFTVAPASLGSRPLVVAQRVFRQLDMVGGQIVSRWPTAQRLIHRVRRPWAGSE